MSLAGSWQGGVRAFSGLPRNVRGALWMVSSAVLFICMTTLVKLLGDRYPAGLQTFYRQAVGFVVLLPLILRMGPKAYASPRKKMLIFRSTLSIMSMILAYYAYQEMPLADANALSFTRSLWLVVLAAFVVREHVGPLRVGAVVVGFCGVILMLWPELRGGFHFGVPALAMLLSSLLVAVSVTGMKVLSRDHSPNQLLVWAMTLGVVIGLPGAILSWRWPTPGDFLLLCLMGAVGTATQACYIRGMHAGDAAAMAPIDYIRLVFAAVAGFTVFGDVPTAWTVAGAAIVVVSTLFITWREQQLARQAKMAAEIEV